MAQDNDHNNDKQEQVNGQHCKHGVVGTQMGTLRS